MCPLVVIRRSKSLFNPYYSNKSTTNKKVTLYLQMVNLFCSMPSNALVKAWNSFIGFALSKILPPCQKG